MLPVMFIGHGSPMNAILDNDYSKTWRKIGEHVKKPSVIVCISAHWVTNGTKVIVSENPKTIYDFYGFPKELYEVEYVVKGHKKTAHRIQELLGSMATLVDEWGIDHGTWSVLKHMFREADVPVVQISIDHNASPEELFEIGTKLKVLRDENVLILGSGNIVHNLRMIDFETEGGFPWAYEFDNYIKDSILNRNYSNVIKYSKYGNVAKYAIPTTEHFNPILFILGATDDKDEVIVYNESCVFGSLSMTSYVFEPKCKE
jgi:4,5-DOPA dioxygenase extradiol